MKQRKQQKADYGQEMLVVIRILSAGGSFAVIAGLSLLFYGYGKSPATAVAMLFSGLLALLYSVIAIWSSRVGKLIMRDRIMDSISWNGNETVLDIGCGQGLLQIAAARRLSSGRSHGIDNYRSTLEFDFSKDKALRNARIEGVETRIDIQTADAQELPFPDGMFDVVVSSLAIHHVPDFSKALREMARVLKHDGTIIIVDVSMITRKYVTILESLGLTVVGNERTVPLFLFPFRMVTARFKR